MEVGRMNSAPFTVIWDIDNTLGQYNEALQSALRRVGHPAGWFEPPTNYNFAKAGWFETIEDFLGHHRQFVEDGLFLDMLPAPGAVEVVSALAERGVRQEVATHRLIGGIEHIVRDTTIAWLENTFPVDFDCVHFTADKWSVPGDLYIDDAPAVIESLDARNLPRMVMDAPRYNQHLPGLRAMTCADVLTHVDTLLADHARAAA